VFRFDTDLKQLIGTDQEMKFDCQSERTLTWRINVYNNQFDALFILSLLN
jgi:hypothetical protein